MSTKITAPVKTEGRMESYFGSRLVIFEDGEADIDFEINDGLRAYLRGAGYGIDGSEPKLADDGITIADPRDLAPVEQVGTPLRDAAIDPRDTDFLAPTNAGEANPHGGEVVAPGIHAVGPGPIVPGTVGSADYQETKESATAEAVLSGDESVPKVTAALNGIARAEYAETKATGKDKGLAQEVDLENVEPVYTDEERKLLGLDEDPEDEDPEDEDPEDEDPEDEDPEDEDPEEDDDDDAVVDAETLKGQALHDALLEAELPTSGTADEKRARLAEHRAQG